MQQPPTPTHLKSPPMYYASHVSVQGAVTPTMMETNHNYPDILDEKFASPRHLIKQSQPLLSKNSFISYLNDSTTSEIPLSPKRRQLNFANAASVAHCVSPMHTSGPPPAGYL